LTTDADAVRPDARAGGTIESLARAHQRFCLLVLIATAVVARIVLAARAPTPYGYVYDFYHEAIQRLYASGRLPASTDCWQCYHPPLYTLLGLPFYALGKRLLDGPAGLSDPALRFVAPLSLVCGAAVAWYGYRILRLYRLRGIELIAGTGVLLAFPCLFISSYGIEADILLSAIMTAFTYHLVRFVRRRRASAGAAVGLGTLAGLACATKYSGVLAPLTLCIVAALQLRRASQRGRIVRELAIALVLCVAVGSWKYVDNLARYGTPFFANGSAQQGFSVSNRPNEIHVYDFGSMRIGALISLARGRVRPAPLTDLPIYHSVWTTLHGLAWSDMTMFSDPSRHGFPRHPYPAKALNRRLVSSVLVLGLLPDALALVGFVITAWRRSLWPLTVTSVSTIVIYLFWVVSQQSWALKTKYILFLLPPYVLYGMFGWRWLAHRSRVAGQAVCWALALLVVLTNLYLFDFAWS
jgi:4-amino-4-deoxy-L-arabinose transferase-like glycosyltransferase